MHATVLNVHKLTPCPEHLQNGSSASSSINVPTTLAPNLVTFMFAVTATLVTILMT
jgi:hypothetical protein